MQVDGVKFYVLVNEENMRQNIENLREAEVIKLIERLRNVKGVPRQAAAVLKRYLAAIPAKARTAKLYFLLANLSVDIGETEQAFAAFRMSARKARQAGDKLILADILRKWGYLCLHTERRLEQAKEKIIEAIAIADALLRQKPDDNDVLKVAANCYASLGNYHWTLRDSAAARNAYENALAFADRAGFKERAVTVLGDLGSIALVEGRWKDALDLLQKTRDRAEKYYQHALPSSLVRLGRFFADFRNPDRDPGKARKYFTESLKVARRGGWKREEADALLELGKTAEANRIYKKIGYHRHVVRGKTPS